MLGLTKHGIEGMIYEICKNTAGIKEVVINEYNTDMIHVSFPIYTPDGNPTQELVQIDMLFTENPDFCKFFMDSPSELESKYKGAHRNNMLRSICMALSYIPIKSDDKGVVEWTQYEIDDSGLYNMKFSFLDESGKRLTWIDENGEVQLVNDAHYARTIQKHLITNNVETCINLLFGPNFNSYDIKSFETVVNIIKNDKKFIHRDKADRIWKFAKEIFHSNENRLVYPTDVPELLD